jgi:type I restriction enzyme S subunit
LGSICKIERGKFTARPRNDPKYYGGNIPFIQTGDVSNSNGVIKKHSQTLNELGLRVSKRFPAGTLFMTIAANIGDIAVTEFDTACPDSLVAILPSNAVHQSWLYHELKRNKLKFQVIASSNAQSNLNLEKITPFLIPLPPTLAEQQAIATVLSDMDTEIESLESKLAKAREIKQGMMQELLTGRIRLV